MPTPELMVLAGVQETLGPRVEWSMAMLRAGLWYGFRRHWGLRGGWLPARPRLRVNR